MWSYFPLCIDLHKFLLNKVLKIPSSSMSWTLSNYELYWKWGYVANTTHSIVFFFSFGRETQWENSRTISRQLFLLRPFVWKFPHTRLSCQRSGWQKKSSGKAEKAGEWENSTDWSRESRNNFLYVSLISVVCFVLGERLKEEMGSLGKELERPPFDPKVVDGGWEYKKVSNPFE